VNLRKDHYHNFFLKGGEFSDKPLFSPADLFPHFSQATSFGLVHAKPNFSIHYCWIFFPFRGKKKQNISDIELSKSTQLCLGREKDIT